MGNYRCESDGLKMFFTSQHTGSASSVQRFVESVKRKQSEEDEFMQEEKDVITFMSLLPHSVITFSQDT